MLIACASSAESWSTALNLCFEQIKKWSALIIHVVVLPLEINIAIVVLAFEIVFSVFIGLVVQDFLILLLTLGNPSSLWSHRILVLVPLCGGFLLVFVVVARQTLGDFPAGPLWSRPHPPRAPPPTAVAAHSFRSVEFCRSELVEENKNGTQLEKSKNKTNILYCFCLPGPPARPGQTPLHYYYWYSSRIKSGRTRNAVVAFGSGGFRVVRIIVQIVAPTPVEVSCLLVSNRGHLFGAADVAPSRLSNFLFSNVPLAPLGGPRGALGTRGLCAVGLGGLLDAMDLPMGSQEPLGTLENSEILLIVLERETSKFALGI